METIETDIAIIGAAGLMCASTSGKKKVHVIEHNKSPGKKILISGGGRSGMDWGGVWVGGMTSSSGWGSLTSAGILVL